MNKYPKISIIIPCFNKAKFIGVTLRSIVEQNYPNLEVILRDPGSTDGSVEIIGEFVKKYSNIFKLRLKKDKGQLEAIKMGLAEASGDILTYLNADDLLKKEALYTVGEYFNKHPNSLWLAGRGNIIDSQGKEISSWVTSYKNFLLLLNSYFLLLITNYLVQPSVFLSREALSRFGTFSGSEKWVMEYDLWLKIGREEMPMVLDKTLSSFRLSKDSISTKEYKKVLFIDEQIAKKYTQNFFILILHRLHNLGRVATLRLLAIE